MSNNIAGHKEINEVIRFAERNGFSVKRGKHIKLRKHNETVVLSISPSCPYGPANAMKDIRKVLDKHGEPHVA
jgi:predicted RNA binding protein YcfA (HicA-like mRNA interferase family)